MTHIPSETKTVSPSIVMPGGKKGTLSFSHTYSYTHIYTYIYNKHTIRGEDSFAIKCDAGRHEGHRAGRKDDILSDTLHFSKVSSFVIY